MPAPPAVEPPASSCPMASAIFFFLRSRGGSVGDFRGARIGHYGQPVLGTQASGHYPQAFLEERKLVVFAHRTGDVHQEYQVRGRQTGRIDFFCLQRHAQQPGSRFPGGGRQHKGRGYRALSHRGGIAIGKVIDHLFNPHRVLRGHGTRLHQEAPQVGVASRIDIDRKGRHGIVDGFQEGVVDDSPVFFRIESGGSRLRSYRRGEFAGRGFLCRGRSHGGHCLDQRLHRGRPDRPYRGSAAGERRRNGAEREQDGP